MTNHVRLRQQVPLVYFKTLLRKAVAVCCHRHGALFTIARQHCGGNRLAIENNHVEEPASRVLPNGLDMVRGGEPLVVEDRDKPTARLRPVRAGDVVLLSPACTSYDEFRDFEERGAAFRELVGEMK